MKSANMVRIPIPYTLYELLDACTLLTVKSEKEFTDDDEYRLMIDVTRGLLPRYESVGQLGTNVIISIFPLRWATHGLGKYFDTGVPLVIPSQRQIPSQYLDPKIKHRSRLHFRMALNETEWPLLLDDDGFITEGPGYNFFILDEKKCILTPRGRNCLRGISRDFIRDLDRSVNEADIDPYDVYTATEAFITGTPFCMIPVTSIDGVKIGNGKPGLIYSLLLDLWGRRVGIDIKQQIQKWDNERPGVSEHRTNVTLQQKVLDVWPTQT
jgi:branched-chain amino acid aminotransferase